MSFKLSAEDRKHYRDIHPDFDEEFLKTAHRPHGYKNLIVMRYDNGKTRKFGQPIKPGTSVHLNKVLEREVQRAERQVAEGRRLHLRVEGEVLPAVPEEEEAQAAH